MKRLFIFSGVLLGVMALGVSFLLGYNYGKMKINAAFHSESKELQNSNSFSENMDIEELLLQQPCYVENVILKEGFLSNEWMLNIIIKNNSEADIETVSIAYATWDTNDLPIQTSIKSDLSNYGIYSEREHVQESNYENANILSGKTSREDDNMRIESTVEIKICKTIIIDYTDYDGNTWENPYYQTWLDKYDGKKLVDD